MELSEILIKIQEVIQEAVLAEREACAELAEKAYHRAASQYSLPYTCGDCASYSANQTLRWSTPYKPFEIANLIRERI